VGVRVRFAPSPTGYLHLGSARTAIHNWLFAKSKGGTFLLRIEDTDVERSDEDSISQIVESLKWLGINWDEDIVFQSSRLELYRSKAEELVEKGLAYRCFCSQEQIERERKNRSSTRYSGKCKNLDKITIKRYLEEGRKYAIRINLDKGETGWNDIVYGSIKVNNDELDDFVILRSNGIATYHFAVVVDDISMGITHVIRGEDHIPNTPKHIILYKMLNGKVPEFCHLPLLLGPDGKRLSKRHGATGINEFREMGFMPEAIFNYLAIIGTSISAENQILGIDELINKYSLKKISKKGAIFDYEKLLWFNKKHIALKETSDILPYIKKLLGKYGIDISKIEDKFLLNIIELMKGRVNRLNEIVEWGIYFFNDPEIYDQEAVGKYIKSETSFYLNELSKNFDKQMEFSYSKIEKVVRGTADRLSISHAELIHPLRIAITGSRVSPDIFRIVELLGKETTIRRLNKFVQKLKS